MTEFVGLLTRLKPGMEEAYEKAHAVVWPELLAAQRELGITRWLIFRDGLELFHTVECEDFSGRAPPSRNTRSTSAGRRIWRTTSSSQTAVRRSHDRLRLVYAG